MKLSQFSSQTHISSGGISDNFKPNKEASCSVAPFSYKAWAMRINFPGVLLNTPRCKYL